MITGGGIPSIKEMTMDDYGLRSMCDLDPLNLRMSSNMWGKRGLVPMGKFIDQTSMYGADLSAPYIQYTKLIFHHNSEPMCSSHGTSFEIGI